MTVYPKKVQLRAFAPRKGAVGDPAAIGGRSASFVCGCYVSFSLTTEHEKVRASFESNGCGYMLAVADTLAEIFSGKDVSELHGLGQAELFNLIETEIGALPSAREHCGEASFEALRNAFATLRTRRIEEFRGDEALICTCFGVSERAIEEFIESNIDVSVEMVADSCRAGSGCGSCRMLIQEMIEAA